MRNHKLEIYPVPMSREVTCWVESPAFGQVGTLPKVGLKRSLVLNDGENRVLVGVYNHDLDLDQIKHLARLAVGQKPTKNDVRS